MENEVKSKIQSINEKLINAIEDNHRTKVIISEATNSIERQINNLIYKFFGEQIDKEISDLKESQESQEITNDQTPSINLIEYLQNENGILKNYTNNRLKNITERLSILINDLYPE